jgi:DNA-binding MarR family transcriptional regulator
MAEKKSTTTDSAPKTAAAKAWLSGRTTTYDTILRTLLQPGIKSVPGQTRAADVFVAYPYSFPIDDYRKALAEAKEGLNVKLSYADEKITSEFILTKILKLITASDICLFDVTNWNPNVTLELGVAIGLGREYYILFNPKLSGSMEVPSDIRGRDRIEYTSYSDLVAKLTVLFREKFPLKSKTTDEKMSGIRDEILKAIRNTDGRSRGEIATQSGLDSQVVQAVLRTMIADGIVEQFGQKKGTRYRLSAKTP